MAPCRRFGYDPVMERASMVVGENIRRWREMRSYGQAELAREAGVSANTLYRIENGMNRPRPATVRKIAEVLHVDPAVLWGLVVPTGEDQATAAIGNRREGMGSRAVP